MRSRWVRPGRAVALVVPLAVLTVMAVAVVSRGHDSPLAAPVLPPASVLVFRPAPSGAASSVPAPSGVAWPGTGQAAYELDGAVHASPGAEPVPIASLAKLMTAYVVVADLPAKAVLRVDAAEVRETAVRRANGESVVPLEVGEVLTRHEALEALLLPSANNVAEMLADATAGSEAAFVDRMNAAAWRLGMHATTYTDPSGYDGGTVSTAADQLAVLRAVLARPELATIAGMATATIPVAGTIASTDTLLGRDGFVAGKTGSTAAAGGCFAFVERDGRALSGVVLGQRGGALIDAGLSSAQALADAAYALG